MQFSTQNILRLPDSVYISIVLWISLGIKASSTPVSSTRSDRRADLTVTVPLMGNRRVTNSRQRYNAFYGYVTGNILLDRKLKWMFKKQGARVCTGIIWLRTESSEGSCEGEHSNSKNGGQFVH